MGALLPVLTLLAIHVPHGDDGFVADDAVAAQCAARSLPGLFTDRRDALCYSGVHFTPLLPASFKIDWAASGLDPTGARIHNWVAAIAVALVAYFWLARFGGILVGSLLATSWIVSPPFTLVTGWLVTRQYLWGFLLTAASGALYWRWRVQRSRMDLFASLVAFAAALLWKDVYLSAALVIPLSLPGRLRERAAAAAPFLAVAMLYLGWRIAMLGGLGGYGEIGLTAPGLLRGIAASPLVTFRELFGSAWLWLLPVTSVGFRPAAEIIAIWSAVVAPLAVVFPSSPVGVFEMRYLFPCSAVAIWAMARSLAIVRKPIAVLGALLILCASLFVALPRSLVVLEELRQAGAEGETLIHLLETDPCEPVTVVGLSRTPQWFATGMKRLYAERLGRPLARAVLVGDLAMLASPGLIPLDDGGRECGLFRYADGEIVRSNGEIARQIEAWLAARSGTAPTVSAEVRGGAIDLHWTSVAGANRYLLFYGEESDIYAAAIPVPRPLYPARNLPSGRYYFRVAAVGSDESVGALSEQIEVVVDGGAQG